MHRLLTELDSWREVTLQPSSRSAYLICLKLEMELATQDEKRQIRILGFLLIYAHKESARVYLANSILCCQDDPAMLVKLGQLFEQHVILPFKRWRGIKTATSSHSSMPSAERLRQDMKTQIIHAPINYADAKNLALIRDHWRCVVTGYLDCNAPDVGHLGTLTECAYIIPPATFFNVKERFSKLDYSVTISTLLKLFHYDINNFTGEKIHSLDNVMTMEKNIYDCFNQLFLYFEVVPGKQDSYEIKHFLRSPPLRLPRFVQFSTKDPEHLPLPDPELLALHATVCKVACMSGAAEYIDVVYKDTDGSYGI